MSNNKNVSTPHISCLPSDNHFAKTVLMPGDPLRAKFIAENFLDNSVLINNVRGIHGYTGEYKGKKVSVMASGMGVPSIGIYSYELFNFYNVDNIIRIGSAGAIAPDVKLRDIIIGIGSCTNSNYASQYQLPGTFAPIASFELVEKSVAKARELKLPFKVGNILSSDTFYDASESLIAWKKMGVLAVEMESVALYLNASHANKNALCICTISDCPFTGESLNAEDRQNSFTHMMELALEIS